MRLLNAVRDETNQWNAVSSTPRKGQNYTYIDKHIIKDHYRVLYKKHKLINMGLFYTKSRLKYPAKMLSKN